MALNPSSPRQSFEPLLGVLPLAAAVCWLIARVFVGLDFTDEMQYYGEILALVRTGRFFQCDSFVQQLGYLFLLPLFQLHAHVFPDQAFLVVFGRVVLLLGYAVVGALYWWTASRRAEFSTAQKLAGLAAFCAWIPFQLFAPGYNSLAYLLVVSAIALTWECDSLSWRRAAVLATILAVLTVTYPPVGVGLALMLFVEAWRRGQRAQATRYVATLAAAAIAMVLLLVAVHGRTMATDLIAAIEFSRAFGVADVVFMPWHLIRWALTIAVGGFLLARILAGGRIALVVSRHPARQRLFVATVAVVLVAGMSILAVRWIGGRFATAFFLLLLLLLSIRPDADRARVGSLALAGLILGSIVAFTSGNGYLNFGLGAAGVIPFLTIHVARAIDAEPAATRPQNAIAGFVPALIALLLLNGVLHPYREHRVWEPLERIAGVPAFAGIWTAPVKREAVDRMRTLLTNEAARGKRLLVAGPHPWLYFLSEAEPATPMFFMHFSGPPEVYQRLGDRLFASRPADLVVLTNAMPEPLARRIGEWARDAHTAGRIRLPGGFVRRYERLTDFNFAEEVELLVRDPP